MPRVDIKKRIKDDVLIDERIQILRLHYDYLKTAMKYLDPKLLDRSKYSNWNLKMVETHSFNSWWSKIGKNVLGRKLDAVKEVKSSSNVRKNSILIDIPLDNPIEYLLRFTKNLTLKQIATELRNKRLKILKQRGKRSAMDRTQTEKFLPNSLPPESLQRQILRYRQKAEIILNNVCKGVFPGDYS